jgi:hypothetical protein
MHRIFVGGKGRKYVIADSALKCVQVHEADFWDIEWRTHTRVTIVESSRPVFEPPVGKALARLNFSQNLRK